MLAHSLSESELRALDEAAELTMEQFQQLPPEFQRAIAALQTRKERERETAEHQAESILDFVPRTTPAYRKPTHLAPLARLIDRARAGERIRALVFAPPRHGKSELLLHASAQWITTRPTDTVAYVTYAADFAGSQSTKARTYAAAAGFQPHPRVDGKSEWRNSDLGGFIAYGLDGQVMGRGFNLLVVDDPHKNRVEAESPAMRARVLDLFKGTLLQRMEPGGSIIVTHQRWVDDDLIGSLKDEGGWEVVELPAIDSDGRPLWPERYDLNELASIRRGNEYNWWSQYMGTPRPRGGAVFKREPSRFEGEGRQGRRIVLSLDGAGTEDTRSDHTVALALAFDGYAENLSVNVVDMLRVQLEPQDSARLLRKFVHDNGGGPLLIESTRDGKAIAKALREIDGALRLIEVPPIGDKYTRAQPVAAAWNDEPCRVALPTDATAHPWVIAFLDEMQKFTGMGDKHDDIVDALSQGWNHATRAGDASTNRPRTLGTPTAAAWG